MSEGTRVVSIIVPARNEEACLADCLKSLVSQTGVDFEIIVVDDDSTDRTAEIARSFTNASRQTPGEDARSPATYVGANAPEPDARKRDNHKPDNHEREGTASAVPQSAPFDERGFSPAIRVIYAPPLPENWTGKNNAMSAGAKAANPKAKWLLFTDADTVHAPGSLARAVAEAKQNGAALLSYSPAQEVHGFWEKAVMPVIFAELATTYPPQAVNDPLSPIAAANGQYLMISREAYDAVGGHAKIATDLLEDVALARLVKRSGRKILFRYAPEAVRTRMYRSFSQLREGWTKNLALLFPRPGWLAVRRLAEFVWAVSILNIVRGIIIWKPLGVPEHFDQWLRLWEVAVFLCVWVYWLRYYVLRMRKAHFSWSATAVSLFGLSVFAYLLLRSKQAHLGGRVLWKEREYGSHQPRPTNLPLRRNTWSGQ
jgi:glycosyltransferase involved in cell wall biosynthesis